MDRIQSRAACILAIGAFAFEAAPVGAASLQPVSNWGASGVPTTVSMYIYVPDKLATNPPILVLSHYCGGSASAVFGQAQGGGVVSAADKYGFIMIVPQAVDSTGKGRCWDVGTTKSLTHDGGGDTMAIAEMVRYTITKYNANANRVYATGDSSGGMMTEALLAVYPDMFKAGSSFAGVPAGCWAVGASSDGTWSSQCAGGSVTFTAQQWGDKVRAMDSTYTGHRPRVQMFHGDADATISYKNLAEGVKEWTNVLGLATNPTSTETGLTLGQHQATRQRWQNSCGYVVLEAITSLGGDHGPSDALFNSSYVIPFLGLDQVGAADPEIAKCGGSGGTSGTGGAPSTGGTAGAGGTKATGGTNGTGGSTRAAGGTMAAGGVSATGGRNTGGAPSTGGSPATGTGGSSPTGGAQDTGGKPSTGGSAASAGSPGQGGTSVAGATGGKSGTNVTTTSATGGLGAVAGSGNGQGGGAGETSVTNNGNSSEPGGCSCEVAGRASSRGGLLAFALGAILLRRRRVSRSRSTG